MERGLQKNSDSVILCCFITLETNRILVNDYYITSVFVSGFARVMVCRMKR